MDIKNKVITPIERFPLFFWQLISISVSILTFTFILLNYAPSLLRPISMSLRTGFGVVIPLTALSMYLVFRLPGRLGDLFSLTATMSLFALGLAGLWASGNTQSVILNGLIPITDAANYYIDALQLQLGADVSNFTAMRPLFAGLLSSFLWISNNNLMFAVAIFTAIAGFTCYTASREIQRTHGTEVAVFFLILIFLYYRHHSGTTMSESLSVPVSLLGVALLWRGISGKYEWSTLFGIGMIALALNIRPGAMFVLPALLFWGSWIFKGEKRFSFRFFGIGTAVILVVFYMNSLMIDFVAGPNGVAFENFAWAFYGLSSGGKPWTYIFEAHPELQLLKETNITPIIYRLAFEQILNNPLLIIKGSFFYWQMFFSNTWYNAYSFVAGDNYWVNQVARWGMYALGLFGILKLFKDRKDPFASLAMITALGVLASVPFVPPTDAYRVRLYAATIPFFVLLPGMGLFYLQEKFSTRYIKHNIVVLPENYSSSLFAVGLVIILIVSPILMKTNGQFPPPPETACSPELDSFFTRYDKGSSINIHRESKVFLDQMPDFHLSMFRRNAHSLPDINLTIILENIEPPKTIYYAVDLVTNQQAFIVVETELLPEPGSLIHFCGEFSYDPEVTPYAFFFAEQVITPPTR